MSKGQLQIRKQLLEISTSDFSRTAIHHVHGVGFSICQLIVSNSNKFCNAYLSITVLNDGLLQLTSTVQLNNLSFLLQVNNRSPTARSPAPQRGFGEVSIISNFRIFPLLLKASSTLFNRFTFSRSQQWQQFANGLFAISIFLVRYICWKEKIKHFFSLEQDSAENPNKKTETLNNALLISTVNMIFYDHST